MLGVLYKTPNIKRKVNMGKLNRRKFCECNICGLVVKPGSRYIRGHVARVNHWSKGPQAKEIKEILSKSASLRVGELSGRYGKTKETNPKFSNAGVPKGTVPYNKGKGDHLTPEKRAIVIAASTGKIPWNKGLAGYFSEEALASISASSKNHIHTEEDNKKVSLSLIEFYKDPEERMKASKRMKGIPKPQSMKRKTSERMRTSANPWYIDGRCSGENQLYPLDFNERFKELIRDRDGRICKICMKTEKENGKLLDIHHINYDKTDCDPKNMISLCHSCHMKTNVKRKDWISFFTKKQITEERTIIN